MSDSEVVHPTERSNPFADDAPEADEDNAICAVYNASFSHSRANEGCSRSLDFGEPLLDDFFDEPLIGVDSNSSVEELEEAILRCKHMFLATPNDPTEKRRRLLERLIDLRRILHNLKESSKNKDSVDGSNDSSLINPLDIASPRGILGSQNSLPSTPSLIPSVCSLRSRYPSAGGHTFSLISGVHCLGKRCEHCKQKIRGPSKKVFCCSLCHIACHTDVCFRGLSRRCPGATFFSVQVQLNCPPTIHTKNLTTISATGSVNTGYKSERRRADSAVFSLPLSVPDDMLETAEKLSCFRRLETTCLTYIGANLSAQSWSCFECHQPIEPAPNQTVLAEHSLLNSLFFAAGSVIEAGVSYLSRKATEPHTPIGQMTDVVTPQLSSQVLSLSDHLMQFLHADTSITVPGRSSAPHLQWAYSPAHAEIGPIQTWGDARVMDAINRICRKPGHVPKLVNGEIKMDDPFADETAISDDSGPASHELNQARLCYYTGRYYCSKCHWGDSHIIPACLFCLGDSRPKPVCRSALLWLKFCWTRSLFRVPDGWYKYEPNARRACSLRLSLLRLKPYVDVCEQARKIKSEFEKEGCHWVFEQPYTFNMALADLVLNGKLVPRLSLCLKKMDDHVNSCQTCSTKVSELCCVCGLGPIRAYRPLCTFCARCQKVCHRQCLSAPLPTSVTDQSMTGCPMETANVDTAASQAEWVEILYPAIKTVCSVCADSN
ncbi:unnamed protein product [Calicophoron daubneyi]|uniref:Phorbol-ester/DAG-type domain-containing protein n=1 Tax=Calicophoron daubneyi TaxID=300641 RepID=A0AAV2TH22_CALDB